MKAENTKNPEMLPVYEIPDLRNHRIVYEFDRSMLAHKRSGGRFLRRCLPFELPAGRFEKLAEDGRLVMLIVASLQEPGSLLKQVVTCPESDRLTCHSARFSLQGEIAQCVNARGELLEICEHDGRRHETVIPPCSLGVRV